MSFNILEFGSWLKSTFLCRFISLQALLATTKEIASTLLCTCWRILRGQWWKRKPLRLSNLRNCLLDRTPPWLWWATVATTSKMLWFWTKPLSTEVRRGTRSQRCAKRRITWLIVVLTSHLLRMQQLGEANFEVSLQDLADALFTKTQSAHCDVIPIRPLIRWWGPCWMLPHESLSGVTTYLMLMASALLVSTSSTFRRLTCLSAPSFSCEQLTSWVICKSMFNNSVKHRWHHCRNIKYFKCIMALFWFSSGNCCWCTKMDLWLQQPCVSHAHKTNKGNLYWSNR